MTQVNLTSTFCPFACDREDKTLVNASGNQRTNLWAIYDRLCCIWQFHSRIKRSLGDIVLPLPYQQLGLGLESPQCWIEVSWKPRSAKHYLCMKQGRAKSTQTCTRYKQKNVRCTSTYPIICKVERDEDCCPKCDNQLPNNWPCRTAKQQCGLDVTE